MQFMIEFVLVKKGQIYGCGVNRYLMQNWVMLCKYKQLNGACCLIVDQSIDFR